MSAAGAAAIVFLIVVLARQGLERAGVLGRLAGIVAAVAAVLVLVPRRPDAALLPQVQVPEWVVDRPAELTAVVSAVMDAEAETVGITTGLYGAGGFGKTVLAKMACADPRVRQCFGDQVYFVTVGRDVREPTALAAKVNDVIKLMTGEDASFADPQLAGQHLGSKIEAGPRLPPP